MDGKGWKDHLGLSGRDLSRLVVLPPTSSSQFRLLMSGNDTVTGSEVVGRSQGFEGVCFSLTAFGKKAREVLSQGGGQTGQPRCCSEESATLLPLLASVSPSLDGGPWLVLASRSWPNRVGLLLQGSDESGLSPI
jgi:hypothetical protein